MTYNIYTALSSDASITLDSPCLVRAFRRFQGNQLIWIIKGIKGLPTASRTWPWSGCAAGDFGIWVSVCWFDHASRQPEVGLKMDKCWLKDTCLMAPMEGTPEKKHWTLRPSLWATKFCRILLSKQGKTEIIFQIINSNHFCLPSHGPCWLQKMTLKNMFKGLIANKWIHEAMKRF